MISLHKLYSTDFFEQISLLIPSFLFRFFCQTANFKYFIEATDSLFKLRIRQIATISIILLGLCILEILILHDLFSTGFQKEENARVQRFALKDRRYHSLIDILHVPRRQSIQ